MRRFASASAISVSSRFCWVSVLLDFAMIFDGFQVIGGSGKKGRRKGEGSTEFHIYLA